MNTTCHPALDAGSQTGKMKILVGMSGGVDSSVTALLLKQHGFDVIGAAMTIREDSDTTAAEQVCDQLGIPFHVVNCVEQFETHVIEDLKHEYAAGRTPNPCVQCNSLVKFGAFIDGAHSAGIEFDKFATGHYVRLEDGVLKRGIDPKKDQSYFLYRLSGLERFMFPLGEFTKEQIRAVAVENGLKVAQKPDSQDFCLGDYGNFLEIPDRQGNIVDTSGKVLGTHDGIWNYTIGKRKGLGVAAEAPLYVLELREATNEVIVGFADETFSNGLTASNLIFHSPLSCKFRSTQVPIPVTATVDGDELTVEFAEPQKSVSPGQSVVLYDGDTVLGGGIIDKTY